MRCLLEKERGRFAAIPRSGEPLCKKAEILHLSMFVSMEGGRSTQQGGPVQLHGGALNQDSDLHL